VQTSFILSTTPYHANAPTHVACFSTRFASRTSSSKVADTIVYFFGASTKVGKHSFRVLLCLLEACSVKLSSHLVSIFSLSPFASSSTIYVCLSCLLITYTFLLPFTQGHWPCAKVRKENSTHAGALVVFKNVDLHTSHWISFACSLTLSCDFATLVSLAARSRLDAAFAPYQL